jgi:hypothetical protein
MYWHSKNIVHKVLLSIAIVSFLIVKLHWLKVPLDRDEGTYLYLGKCFAEGYRPYIDFYEIKPPGVFFVYGIFYWIFGSEIVFLHVGLALLQAATAGILYHITSSIYSNKSAGVMAFSSYLIFSICISLMSYGLNSEFFIVFLMVAAWYFLLKSKDTYTNVYLFVSGVCIALAVLIRQQAVLFLLPHLWLYYVTYKGRAPFWKHFVFLSMGGISFALLLFLYVFAYGSVQEMYYWVWERPFSFYLENIPWSKGQTLLLGFLQSWFSECWPLLTASFVGFILTLLSKTISWHYKIFFILLFITASLAIVPGNRFFPHYWIYLLPFLSIGTAGLSLVKTRPKLIFIIFSIMGLIQIIANRYSYFSTPAIETYTTIYGKNPNIAVKHVTDYLKKILKKDDQIYVFGSEPQVYFETGKVPPLRHVYVAFAFQPVPTDTIFQKEILSFLQDGKPEYIVHVQNSLSVLLHPKSSKKLYESIFELEANDYQPILFAKINDDLSIDYYYDKDAQAQSIFEKNYVVLYKKL